MSAVWNIWVVDNEVYLAPRLLAGEFKLSLHSSGDWRLAGTKQSGVVFEGDRTALSWRRPGEFRPGWTHAVSIIVPYTTVERPLPGLPIPADKEVIWIPRPEPGEKVAIFILLSSPGAHAARDFDELHVIYGDGHTLPNGETVWLVSRTDLLTESEAAQMNEKALGMRFHTSAGVKGTHAANLFVVGGDDHPVITDIVLGEQNVYPVQTEPELPGSVPDF